MEDLDISTDSMLRDPDEFAALCIAKAEELKAICKEDTSVNALERKIRSEGEHVKIPTVLSEILMDFYQNADDISAQEIIPCIEELRILLKDMENMFRSKVMTEALNSTSPMANKKIAHIQYTRLREAYNSYRRLAKLLFELDESLPEIESLPGNYGDGPVALDSLAYYLPNEPDVPWYSPYSVAKKLGIQIKSIKDLLDYLRDHPECGVVVKKVVL